VSRAGNRRCGQGPGSRRRAARSGRERGVSRDHGALRRGGWAVPERASTHCRYSSCGMPPLRGQRLVILHLRPNWRPPRVAAASWRPGWRRSLQRAVQRGSRAHEAKSQELAAAAQAREQHAKVRGAVRVSTRSRALSLLPAGGRLPPRGGGAAPARIPQLGEHTKCRGDDAPLSASSAGAVGVELCVRAGVGAQTKEREALQDERVQLKVQIKMLKAQLAEMDSARSAASSMGQRRGRHSTRARSRLRTALDSSALTSLDKMNRDLESQLRCDVGATVLQRT
jgi:hypothetical protein